MNLEQKKQVAQSWSTFGNMSIGATLFAQILQNKEFSLSFALIGITVFLLAHGMAFLTLRGDKL